MQRISQEPPESFCPNCHQPLSSLTSSIHQSYCSLNTPPCLQCSSALLSTCRYCQSKIPPCHFPSHTSLCRNRHFLHRGVGANSRRQVRTEERDGGRERRRLNVGETVCPYCKKETNGREVLRHIDVCRVRGKNAVVLVSDWDGGSEKGRRRVSIEKEVEAEEKEPMAKRLHRKLGIKRNNRRKVEEAMRPQTELVVPIQDAQNQDANSNNVQKRNKEIKTSNNIEVGEIKSILRIQAEIDNAIYQLRLSTPVPVSLVPNKWNNELFSGIKPIGIERQNVGKLIKNL